MMRRKGITAQQIIDNLNARIQLSRKYGDDTEALQGLLDAICRHGAKIEDIDDDTADRGYMVTRRQT